jgi:hypothetical protein
MFVFVCPKKQKGFASASFEIISNKGITLDMKGYKFLDAKVALEKPFPFCGEKHVYHAREVSFPFGSDEKVQNPVKEHTHG